MLKKVFHKFLDKVRITQIINNQEQQLRNQDEILKGLIFNNTIIDSEWLKYKSFSPGVWAADYGLLYTLYRVLDGMKPKSILEFGLGQSSKLIHQYADYFQIPAITCEHDRNWIRFFNEGKDGCYEVTIKILELETIEYKGFDTLSYKHLNDELEDQTFDLIVVDAPFGSKHYSRSQIIQLAQNNLSNSFCIIVDDYERSGEQETVDEVKKIFKSKGIDFCERLYSASKQHYLLCSKDLIFLTSM